MCVSLGAAIAFGLVPAVRAMRQSPGDALRAHARGFTNHRGAAGRAFVIAQVALSLMRQQDRLTACELEPKAAAALASHLRRDKRAKAIEIDGWQALNAYLPPPERRGLVVVDPPFEDRDEFENLAKGLELAHRKWASGIFLLWYPIKGEGASAFMRRLRKLGIPKILRAELHVKASRADVFSGSGLAVINPPWKLADELKVMLPALQAVLSQGPGSRTVLEMLDDKI